MKRELRLLLMGDLLLTLATGMFGPLYAVFVDQIGGDLLTAGWAYATYAIVTGVLILIISRFEDKMKREEYAIIAGYSLFTIGTLCYLFIQSPWQLFVVQIVLGIATAVTYPAWDGIYSEFLDKGKFASEWGLEEAQTFIFSAIAAAVGGSIAHYYGFKTLFFIMFIFAFMGTLVSLGLLRK